MDDDVIIEGYQWKGGFREALNAWHTAIMTKKINKTTGADLEET